MQRSIAAFFQPMKSKEKSDGQVKAKTEPVKSPLKIQNGVQENDSPVKKVHKRSRAIIESDDEDQPIVKEQGPKHSEVQTAKPEKAASTVSPKTPITPTTPVMSSTSVAVVTPASSGTPGTPATPTSTSPSGIPKRRTARKQFPKRKLESRSDGEGTKEEEKELNGAQESKRARVESSPRKTDNEMMEVEEKSTDGKIAVEEQKEEDEAKTTVVEDDANNEMKEKDKSVVKQEKKINGKNGKKEKKEDKKEKEDSTPRKAAVKLEKEERNEGEKKKSGEISDAAEQKENKSEKGTDSAVQSQYDPSRAHYNPVDHACWRKGQKVPYLAVARTFEKIEEDSGRLKNIETLSNFLRSVILLSPNDLLCCVYLCLNQLGPAYQGLELGVGETVLMKAVAQATGRQLDKIKAEAQEKGDLGLVAESSRSNQRMMFAPANLTAGGAMNKKIDIIKGLFVACRFSEARYIVRVPTSCAGCRERNECRKQESVAGGESTDPETDILIHILENGEVRIFSRNQEDNTSKYPDIISRIPQVKKENVRSCVLDSEAVAWDREKKQIQPFQVLTTRKRKDVDASEIKVQVCVYAFDLLYLNGESLVREPLCKRRALLWESFEEKEGEFVFARSLNADNTEAIAEFLEQSVRDSCEGLMVKTLEKHATYEIAKRSHNWLKLKKDYLEGVGDTVDLCVIGAYLGKGKRAGSYGGFLLACYDEENEEFQSVCKIGTGFKDEDLEQHYNLLKEHILPKPRPYYRVDQSAEPDVWLEAVQVWEVKCADLSLSPVYKAAMGLVDPEKGISLRFPRYLRIRDDKKPEDATTGSQIADLYKKQQQIQNQGEKQDLEDYY
ncbi:hypothetical protein cypCar_00004536 [Cyprinus carpio]|nr:hypothetical protein cypCar_00004536 [Cyprinus carpio]